MSIGMTFPKPDSSSVPNTIAPEEILGRGVFSGNDRKRARRGSVPPTLFMEQGNNELSVDRLTHAPIEKAVELGNQRAESRGSDRNFHGWAVVKAFEAARNGREVLASPLSAGTNPFHADIVLPELVVNDKVERLAHASELARVSTWKELP